MTYSRYAPYGRRYHSAIQYPKGSVEEKTATQMAAHVNYGAVCTLMYKYPNSTAFDDIREWDKHASYRIVTPERSGSGSESRFSVTGPARPSPEHYVVPKPSQEEIEAIYDNKLVGRFAGGEIFRIPEAENTGAIPVIDTQDPKKFFYYVPAFFERLANDERFFEKSPSFIAIKEGEMPSFVFWQRDPKWPRHVVDAQVPEPLTATPQIASKSPVPQSTTQDARGLRSRAPSPPERSLALAVDTEGAAQVSKKAEAEAELQWEIFDPRLEEDPIEFLDFYNTRLNGWHGYRSRMMMREADIERVNFISPCLAHNHKEVTKDVTTNTAPATTITPSPVRGAAEETAMEIDSATNSVPKVPEAAPSKPWVQPGPIGEDDPAWKRFYQKQAQRTEVRQSRIRPKPVFTLEYCNTPGIKKNDSKKAILNRKVYEDYFERACKAQRATEGLSKCCLACGLKWVNCTESRQEHYNQHRQERKLWYSSRGTNIHVEPALRVESLDPSRVDFDKNVPGLNWFRDLEHIILNLENDLLEREHTCRVCDEHLDPADNNIAIHYNGHGNERKYLRNFYHKGAESPHSPTIVTTADGSFQVSSQDVSPPARPVGRFSMNEPFAKRHAEVTEKARLEKAALLENMADNLIATGKEIKRTGVIPSSVEPLVQPKEVGTEPQLVIDAMGLTGDGPTHSDEIGKTTARLAFAPWLKSSINPLAKGDKNIDFIYGDSDAPAEREVIIISSDSESASDYESQASQVVNPFQAQSSARSSRSPHGAQVSRTAGKIIKPVDVDSDLYRVPPQDDVNNVDDTLVVPSTSEAAEIEAVTEDPGIWTSESEYGYPESVVTAIRHKSGELFELRDSGDVADEIEVASSEAVEEQPDFDDNMSEDFYEYGDGLDINDIVNDVIAKAPMLSAELLVDVTYLVTRLIERIREAQGEIDTGDLSVKEWVETHVMDYIGLQLAKTPSPTASRSPRNARSQQAASVPVSAPASSGVPDFTTGEPDAVEEEAARVDIWAESVVPVKNDGLDFSYNELGIKDILRDAIERGIQIYPLSLLMTFVEHKCAQFVKAQRAKGRPAAPRAKQLIIELTQGYLKRGISLEEDLLREEESERRQIIRSQSQRSTEAVDGGDPAVSQQSVPASRRTPRSSSRSKRDSGRSTGALTGRASSKAPSTQRHSTTSTRRAERQSEVSDPWAKSESDSTSEKTLKRKRLAPLPATPISIRNRKDSRNSDSTFIPDEVSPRSSKMPRKSTDPLYRPGSALFDPTTPPVTPKRPSAHKAPEGEVKKAEKGVEKKSAAKVEKAKETKKVEFEFEPRVPVTLKWRVSKKITTPAKIPRAVSNKPSPKAAAAAAAASATPEQGRPKRKAAVEAAKKFGKTKIVG